MTDRPSRRTHPTLRVLTSLLLGLLLTGCSEGSQGAEDPAPTTASSSPTDSESAAATGEPCDAIDTAALTELVGLEFDDVEPYEEGKKFADGCSLSSSDGDLAVVVDIREDHGDLDDDLDEFGGVPRKATAQPATIAGREALTAAGEQSGVTVSAIALHLEDDRLFLVSVVNFFASDVTGDDGTALATSIAEMVVPVL